jgi:hypothetical protein
MKILLMLMLAAVPASAQWGGAEGRAAAALSEARAETTILGAVPLLDLLAARDKVSQPVTIAGKNFLATVVFDAAWDTWFSLKPVSGLGAGAWKETDLAAGAVYKYGGLELLVKETDGVVTILGQDGSKAEVAVNALFDRLYNDSTRITFGGAVTYAVFRNLEPLSEDEGTVTMRKDDQGLYYYSITSDAQITSAPRWLLAINWVLYGLKVEESSLLFVSKPIENAPDRLPALRAERRR